MYAALEIVKQKGGPRAHQPQGSTSVTPRCAADDAPLRVFSDTSHGRHLSRLVGVPWVCRGDGITIGIVRCSTRESLLFGVALVGIHIARLAVRGALHVSCLLAVAVGERHRDPSVSLILIVLHAVCAELVDGRRSG